VPERVAWLVGAHVTAKRYLCAIEPAYWDGLSRGSKRSLELQGGPLSKKASAEFKSHAWHADAVRLRRWDDEAKDPSRHTPDLIEFIPLLLQYVD
jgi:gamma-butyrobetaine dioxygenase